METQQFVVNGSRQVIEALEMLAQAPGVELVIDPESYLRILHRC